MIFKSLLIEFQHFYPELVHRCFVVNTPMFFESFFESEIKPFLAAKTAVKVFITGENTHKGLLENVDQDKLPRIYGGLCETEATVVYSDRGPWNEIENKINY